MKAWTIEGRGEDDEDGGEELILNFDLSGVSGYVAVPVDPSIIPESFTDPQTQTVLFDWQDAANAADLAAFYAGTIVQRRDRVRYKTGASQNDRRQAKNEKWNTARQGVIDENRKHQRRAATTKRDGAGNWS